MLARYQIVRGARPASTPLPAGIRQDTRKHTRHVLRPTSELVSAFLRDPTAAGFERFQAGYRSLLEARYEHERRRFDELAALAREHDVYIGCNCPTTKQPLVERCHTTLALKFFQRRYRNLDVRLP